MVSRAVSPPPGALAKLAGWEGRFAAKMREGRPLAYIQGIAAEQDRNLRAHMSLSEYIDWFAHWPETPEPHRDAAFYPRDFTFLLEHARPEVIVELGTDKGAGTLMLHRLCPDAMIVTVDNREEVPAPNGMLVPTGWFAIENDVPAVQRIGRSWELSLAEFGGTFDFCFIDAGHDMESVRRDSEWAWEHKDAGWCIAWHDYRVGNPEFDGLIEAVDGFSLARGLNLYRLPGSATAWCASEAVIARMLA